MSIFAQEKLAECKDDVWPVLRDEHWEETGDFDDLPYDMDWEIYAALEKVGILKCYTIRGNSGHLEGYVFFLVAKHLHHRHTLCASADILYVRKPFRGIGREFLTWCDEQLKNEGATMVMHHLKPFFNYGTLYEKMGYEKAETLMIRRF